MTILSKKQQAAIDSRAANKTLMSQRKAGVLSLPLPTFDSLNANGLISYENSKKPLPVTFDISELAEEEGWDLDATGIRLDVHMRGRGASQWGAAMYVVQFQTTLNPTFPPITAPFIRDIPVSRMTEGEHEVGYILYEGSSPTPLLDGAPLEVDLTAPEHPKHPQAPVFPAYLSSGKITQQDVDDHPEGLECTYPDYATRKGGDRIAVYFSPDFSSQLSEELDTFPVDDDLGFTLDWDLIKDNLGGQNYLFYVLIDLAGIPSKDSTPARITLELTPAPDPQEAFVPLARQPADGVLDLADLYDPEGVFVAIPQYVNNLPLVDVVELIFGTRPPLRFPVNSFLPFPLMLPISRANLLADYGTATGELPTTIAYFIDRNGTSFDAPDHEIAQDYSAEGPPPTPDPENPAFNLVTVYGSDPDVENELPAGDFEVDATVELVLWDTPLPAPGARIRGYWDDLAHEFMDVTLTTEGPGDTLTGTAPWATIRTVGNKTVKVFYTVGWDTNDNIQRSRSQDVVVNANKVVLQMAIIKKATATWACTDLNPVNWAGTVHVPGNSVYFKEFMVIRCEFRVFSDITGDTQVGTTLVLNSPPLTPAMVTGGFDITVPYASLRPAVRNSVDFHYFVPIPGEGDQPSVRAWTRTRFTDLNGLFCEQQPPTV